MRRPYQSNSGKSLRKAKLRPKRRRRPAQGQDLSERSRIWQALLESEDRYRATFDGAPVGILHSSVESDRILHVNPKLSEMLGYTRNELLGMTTDDILHPDHAGADRPRYREKMLSGELDSFSSERKYVRKNHSVVWVNRTVSLVRDSLGKPVYFIRIMQDITVRKQAEASLERLLRARHDMAECNRVLVHAVDENAMLEELCRTLVESGSYTMAWVALATGDSAHPLRAAAHAGFGGNSPMSGTTTRSAQGRLQRVVQEVVDTGHPYVARGLAGDPALLLRRARAEQQGFQSSIALPLKSEGRILGAVAIHARAPEAFDADEVPLLTSLANDIAFRIASLRERIARQKAEVERRESEQRLSLALEGTGQALFDWNIVTGEVFLSPRWNEILGGEWTPVHTTFEDLARLVHPEDSDDLKASIVGSLKRDTLYRTEHRIRNRAGAWIWIQSHGKVTARDAQGRALRLVGYNSDITPRKLAELALAESEERFRATFEQAAVGITHVNLDGVLVNVNQKFCDMLGYGRDELIGKTVSDITHPDDYGQGSRYREMLTRSALESASGEKRFLRKDGAILWARRTMSTACDGLGKPRYVISIVEDITARRRAESESKRSLSLLQATLDSTADGILVVDGQGRVTSYNQKFLDLWRIPDALAATRDDERMLGYVLAQLTDPDKFIGKVRELYLRPAESSEDFLVFRDGRVYERFSRPQVLDGELVGRVWSFRDITERKRAEEAFIHERVLLRTIIDTVPDYIYVKDAEGRFQLANKAWLKERNLSNTSIAGKTVFDVFPAELAERMAAQDADIVRTGVPIRDLEQKVVLNPREGEFPQLRWYSITKVLMQDASGQIIGTVGVSRDITMRKHSAIRGEMEHAVTMVISEAASVEEAMPKLLDTICRAMNWAYGARWSCNDEEGLLRADYWADFEPDFDPEDSENWVRQGVEGSMVLLHRAWRHGEPTWVADIEQHATFRRRASSRKFGLHSAFAFPILAGGRVIGIMEFFGRESRQPDGMLLQVVRSIGSQIGQFMQRKEAERALRASEERYRDVFDASPLPMWIWDDATLNIVAVNLAAIAHYGYSRDEFLGMNVRDLWAPGEVTQYERNIRNRSQQQTLHLQRRHRTKDGRIIHTEVTARLFSLGGQPVWLTVVNDVSERMHAEAALRESEEQFRQLAGNIPQVFWITDTFNRQTLYVSPAAETMLGRPLRDILSDRRSLIRAVHKEDRARVHAARKTAMETGYDETYRIVRQDNSIRWVHDRAFPVRDGEGRVYRIAGIAEDVTDRKHAEERLEHLAHYDTLTNLPNRALFYERLKQTLAQARRNRWTMGVMFIDADRFKNVNDTLGHAVGDKLLQEIAGRLTRSVRSDDTVGRLGGDEFAIVLSTLASAQDATLVAQKIMAAFREPFRLEVSDVYVTASVGITLYPNDSTDQDVLIKNADTAMYRAKEIGRDNYQFYTPEMNTRAIEHLGMENSLRRALERDEFLLHYQPKVSVMDGDITGVEALLRWRHPERGLVSPADFIPLLEESGLIIQVGEWVLKTVCLQIKAWARAGIRPVPVSVNLSARQFAANDLGQTIRRILEEHQVDSALIELEITESALMENTGEAVRTLEYLDRLGVSLAIDDFGTGYSSLGYLKRFPLTALKIDRSFVRDVTTDGDDATITRAVISMAHSLGLKVIAEGVETRAQLEFLAEYGCDEVQGYYFAKPMPAEECGNWVREPRRLKRPQTEAGGSVPVVLLLDDDDDARAHLQRTLARDGYRILAASNAREGLALLRDHRVDVVVSDQNMPGMSGVDFLQCVQSLSPKTMRILTTGYADFQTMADAVNKGGIFRCLPKDIGDDALRDHVRKAVQARFHGLESTIPPGTVRKQS